MDIKQLILNYYRTKTIKDITGNIGEIIEMKEKIICRVDQKKLDNWYKYHSKYDKNYHIPLNGINPTSKEIDNMSIHYIFDNIQFTYPLKFSANYKPTITFNNCTFKNKIDILSSDGKIYFKNNYFMNETNDIFNGKRINKIVFEKSYIKNKYLSKTFIFKIEANEIQLNDLTIDTDSLNYHNDCIIKANKLLLKNSYFKMNQLDLNVNQLEQINSFNCPIIAKNLTINNPSYNSIKNIYANKIIYNNVLIKDDKLLDNNENIINGEVNIDPELIQRIILKSQIIKMLKEVKNECINTKNQVLTRKEEELNKLSIQKLRK